jgi:octaprenyl-diphosphate synthase
VGKDLREGKITLPLINALSRIEASERELLIHRFTLRDPDEKDFLDIFELVRERGNLQQIRDEAAAYVNRAQDALHLFDDSPAKEDLHLASRYLVNRTY